MEKMGVAEPQLEDLFKQKKHARNPLVPIGLISFRQGKSQLRQKIMRAHVVTQGATVALIFGSAYYYGDQFKGSK
ncbi:Hypoxia induced protein domain-containing protein [Dioscorea alata]|uniref:Hypoxia induced protein domain-containing protein n=1 Tax=Dioscorea alata TaxID=55571 RepID=A0ACB7VK38_DIOAL|nr:Hypoxia induced protein domain-containing protein [Dioscorea alata]